MNDIEKRARELLAVEYERSKYPHYAADIRAGVGQWDQEIRAIVAALTPPDGDMGNPMSVPEGFVPASAVLVCATRLRRLASAASPLARTAYIKAAEDIELTVSAARPEVGS